MKYFFLAENWHIGRVWEFGGQWDLATWRRPPNIQRTSLGMETNNERFWLYQVEDAVLMLEIRPDPVPDSPQVIGQVMIKRLMTPEEAIAQLNQAAIVLKNNVVRT